MATPRVRNRRALGEKFAELGYKRGAEVGVADGRFSTYLCETIPELELFCVDPWHTYSLNRRGGPQSQHDGNYELAKERLAPYNATLIRSYSAEAVETFEDGSLDFVYIDGNHDFDFVMLDLILWTPKVRTGGIVSGHDYYHFSNSGVVEAVDAYCGSHGITFGLTRETKEKSYWWMR